MNVAYLILAHYQPRHVARLIETIDCDWAEFFIHVDAKSDLSDFKKTIGKKSNLSFLENNRRFDIRWSGFRQLEATLGLVQTALDYEREFRRYCLLSGADYPIKNIHQIRKVLESDIEFLRVDRRLDGPAKNPHSKYIERYYFNDISILNPRSSKIRALTFVINSLIHLIPRRSFLDLPIYHGAQWWCITHECMSYILNCLARNSEILRFLRFTRGSDELCFQSVAKSSPFAGRISHDFEKVSSLGDYFATNEHGCHYIDWNAMNVPLPKVLDEGDIEAIRKSKALFARKFDENRSRNLVDWIDGNIL